MQKGLCVGHILSNLNLEGIERLKNSNYIHGHFGSLGEKKSYYLFCFLFSVFF